MSAAGPPQDGKSGAIDALRTRVSSVPNPEATKCISDPLQRSGDRRKRGDQTGTADVLRAPVELSRRTWAVLLGACMTLFAMALLALGSGRYPLSPAEVGVVVWDRLTGSGDAGMADAVVWQIRMPRAFIGGLAAVGVVMFIASRLSAHEPLVTLILTGVVVASLLGAAISLLKYLADPYNQLPAITFWLMGSFAAASGDELRSLVPAVALALVVLFALAWRINLLALPEDEARALGVNTRRLRAVVIAAATLATSASVAVSGIIGWVGLVVPHMARMLVGPEFSRLLPVAALFGAMFMLMIDTIARTLAVIEVPPGILTAVVGTPAFIALLARTRRVF